MNSGHEWEVVRMIPRAGNAWENMNKWECKKCGHQSILDAKHEPKIDARVNVVHTSGTHESLTCEEYATLKVHAG